MKTLNLKARLAIAVSIGALAVVAGISAVAMHFAQRDLLDTLSSQQAGLVAHVAADLDAKLRLATDAVTTAAAAIPRDAIETGTFDAFFIQQPALLQNFDDVLIVDANGIVRADYPHRDGRVGVDVSERVYFRREMASGRPMITEPVFGKVTGLPLVGVIAPILGPDGRIVALMIGLLRLTKSSFLGALSAARIGRTGYFTVVTAGPESLYLAHPDAARLMQKVSQERAPALVNHRPLTQVDWIVTATVPGAEAFAAMDRARTRTIGIAIAAALLVLPMAWLVTWRVLRPLTALRTQVERVAGDPSGKTLASAGPGDLGRIATAFNGMVAARRSGDALRIASDKDRRRLVAILESSQDFVAITDPDGHLTYVNASGRRVCGVGSNEDVGATTLHDYFPPWALQKLLTEGVPAALADGIWLGETAILTVDGREIPVDHTVVAHREIDGRVGFFSSLLHDTSTAKALAAAMRASEARMLLIADALPVLVAFVDRDYRFSFVNSRYEDHFGVERSTIVGRSIAELIGPDAYEIYLPHLQRASHGETQVFDVESTASVRPVHFAVKLIAQFDEADRLTGYHLIHQDVSDHKAEHHRLSQLARADPLTGLLNRAGFETAIDEAMQRSRVYATTMALFYLDVDRFKSINDRHGHLVGDALLRAFAGRLVHAVRSADIVSRLGGDEFVIIAEGLRSTDDLRSIAGKILAAMRPEFDLSGLALSITASIGVAAYAGSDIRAEELVERADAALYRAKNAGRNCYELDEAPKVPGAPGVEAQAAAELSHTLSHII